MPDRIVEVHDGGGGGALTALAIVLLLIVLLVVLYFTGVFGRMFGTKKTDINVDINKPGVVLQLH
ncbi:MAG TPA: hypothetical protein VNN73_10305 [Blastocatellia bacterium]|nr:hypothetical protein [Blastocatellia bacterium]